MLLGARPLGSRTLGDGTGDSGFRSSVSDTFSASTISASGTVQAPTLVDVAVGTTISAQGTVEPPTIDSPSLTVVPVFTIEATGTVRPYSFPARRAATLHFVDGTAVTFVDSEPASFLHPHIEQPDLSVQYDDMIHATSGLVFYAPLRDGVLPTRPTTGITTTSRVSVEAHGQGPRGLKRGLDVSRDYVTYTGAVLLQSTVTTSFTLEAWVRHPNALRTGTTETIVRHTVRGVGLEILSTGAWRALFINDSNNFIVADASSVWGMNDGRWHHIVGRLSGGKLEIFIDGFQKGENTTTSSVSYQTNSISVGSFTTSQYLTGSVAGVAFYTSALTGDAIREHYLSGIMDLSDRQEDLDPLTIYTPTVADEERAGFTPISAPIDLSQRPVIRVTSTSGLSADLGSNVAPLADDHMVLADTPSFTYATTPNWIFYVGTFDSNDHITLSVGQEVNLTDLSPGGTNGFGPWFFRLTDSRVAVMWVKDGTANLLSIFDVDVGTGAFTFIETITLPYLGFSSVFQGQYGVVLDENTIVVAGWGVAADSQPFLCLVYRDVSQATPSWGVHGPFYMPSGFEDAVRDRAYHSLARVDSETVLWAHVQEIWEDYDLTHQTAGSHSFVLLHVDRDRRVIVPIDSLSRRINLQEHFGGAGTGTYTEYIELTSLSNNDFYFQGYGSAQDYFPEGVVRSSITVHVDLDTGISVLRGMQVSEDMATVNQIPVALGDRYVLLYTDTQTDLVTYANGNLGWTVTEIREDGKHRAWVTGSPNIDNNDYVFFFQPAVRVGDRSVVVVYRDYNNLLNTESVVLAARLIS